MKLDRIQDFAVWKKAEAFCDAVDAILARPEFAKKCNVVEQIRDANESILANMSEGFEQPTDRAFVRFLYTSKGSAAETCTRLARAAKRGCLTEEELGGIEGQASEVGRMLGGLIRHLMKTPNRRRGVGKATSD